MTGGRRYTDEQIDFVLNLAASRCPNEDIVKAYQARYNDGSFGKAQLKYLKGTYSKHPQFGLRFLQHEKPKDQEDTQQSVEISKLDQTLLPPASLDATTGDTVTSPQASHISPLPLFHQDLQELINFPAPDYSVAGKQSQSLAASSDTAAASKYFHDLNTIAQPFQGHESQEPDSEIFTLDELAQFIEDSKEFDFLGNTSLDLHSTFLPQSNMADSGRFSHQPQNNENNPMDNHGNPVRRSDTGTWYLGVHVGYFSDPTVLCPITSVHHHRHSNGMVSFMNMESFMETVSAMSRVSAGHIQTTLQEAYTATETVMRNPSRADPLYQHPSHTGSLYRTATNSVGPAGPLRPTRSAVRANTITAQQGGATDNAAVVPGAVAVQTGSAPVNQAAAPAATGTSAAATVDCEGDSKMDDGLAVAGPSGNKRKREESDGACDGSANGI